MKEFIDYLLLFGNLNQQQIDFISKKGVEKILHKDEYFAEAGKVVKHLAFTIDGVLRICYYNNQGEEITRYFLDENHIIYSFKGEPLSEYVQAATDCRLLLFTNSDWREIENTIAGWDAIFQKIVNKTLAEKLDRRSPLIEQDATTRYLMFLEKFPTLVNRISLAYIASYLGMTASSLSRIRRNIR
ncbi:Crp/Fnr family transcriptional regulator [Rhizosphaericola mali]|uniref:Crp/Fnr family transcriptional regulator n=1 Tax=Rhizosphaericola mali TaxID=2545455 RepID=A0A5P2G3D6_9BACT|nr:Crp/Fnr family transcriptional regulator [Rhizosphaericola mali]QES88332.1 Crp/Fnr family transcriptional regulator [Rhizosphaericola mali]